MESAASSSSSPGNLPPLSVPPEPTAPLLTAGEPSVPKEQERRRITRVLSGFLFMVGVVALKLKALLFLAFENFRLLLVNPFEGFGAVQYAVAGGSMLLSIGAYATKWPLGLGVGFMTIILVHEVGHAVVIRAKGLRAGMMVFIPFIGGAVTLKDQPTSVFDDAQIGLAGPLAGTIASLIALQIYKWTANPLYLLIAFAGFIINLVNLLPIGMLDGGRISAAVTKWMWVFGGAALTYKVFKQPNPLMILVLVLAIFQVYASIMREKSDKFYEITRSQRAAVAVAYFSLIVFLGHQAYMSLERLTALKR